MPVTPTYPGVYIEEIPSGVHTLTGVATSITAFVGRALRGPTNAPVMLNSYGDYERIFGGLWAESAMSFAVRDFFQNGGGQAIIVRLCHYAKKDQQKAVLGVETLNLVAVDPGAWGNQLRARVNHTVRPALPDEGVDTMFNLFIRDGGTGVIEEFRNVSIEAGHPRQVDKVLANTSKLVRVDGSLAQARPSASSDATDEHKTIWDDSATATNYKVESSGQASDGDLLDGNDFKGTGKEGAKEGLYALEKADLFNILCIPPYKAGGKADDDLISTAATYCEKRRAFYIVDSKPEWTDKEAVKTAVSDGLATSSKNAAIFFPRIQMANPLHDNQIEEFAACGAIAGIFARTDAQRGIWKAPAGMEATLNGVPQLAVSLTDAEIGELNPLGVNCLKLFPGVGRVIWGSRTLQGNDMLASEWKYIPVRRFALYIEESLYRGTQWAVFEPNDEPLWAQIRLNLGSFMHGLFRQGAFQGSSPREAYFVKCDKETTTQADINRGVVNIQVGFAPLKPAEFVIIQIQQIAGQIQA